MSHKEASNFFIKEESYCNFSLPPYFSFNEILSKTYNILSSEEPILFKEKPSSYEGVNYTILMGKGCYVWRPLSLIHPAIYTSLVINMTKDENWEQIKKQIVFLKNGSKNIDCASFPVESLQTKKSKRKKDQANQISNWWSEVEQKSISLALQYKFVIHTDITDCYKSIYTHSIPWALHGKDHAKKERWNQKLIGNVIDEHIRHMSYGQTNGIPQGSSLMDFIADIVLSYADKLLSEKIDEIPNKYKIIRYRDDYRIFVNNLEDGEKILKALTEVMISLGFSLNPLKTSINDCIIQASIKSDKLSWIEQNQNHKDFQKNLLAIYQHGMKYPNSGSQAKALSEFDKKIKKTPREYDILPMVSIVTDIAYRNPRQYPVCSSILSYLIGKANFKDAKNIIKSIDAKFQDIPNTEYMDIWLQRLSLPFIGEDVGYKGAICNALSSKQYESIWDNEWVDDKNLKRVIGGQDILDWEKFMNCLSSPFIDNNEVNIFEYV